LQECTLEHVEPPMHSPLHCAKSWQLVTPTTMLGFGAVPLVVAVRIGRIPKPTGFFWVKLPLGSPHFSLYDVALYYTA
jgi:hypothetical protein